MTGTPHEWRPARLKYEAGCNRSVLAEDTDPDYEFVYVDIGDVTQGHMDVDHPTTTFGAAPSRARRLAATGDIAVSTVRTYLRAVVEVPESDEPLVLSTGFAVLHPSSGVVRRWLAYYLQSDAFVSRVVAYSDGVSYPAIAASRLMSFGLLLPPPNVQQAIADFLDEQASRIDTLIDKQTQLITTLRERRAAITLQTVTKGRRANASHRPSGLRWAGDVPAAWDVANIRRYATMKTGHTPSRFNSEFWYNCTIPWLTLADVWQLRDGRATYLTEETATRINEAGLENSSAELLPAGTVVLSRTASVGFSGIMPVPMATSQDYWNWVCGPKLLPTFLLATFRAMSNELGSLVMGSTHKTIYQPVAASMSIVIPPLDEQQEIVDFLGEQTSRIDALIAKTEEHMALAKERRAALITAAVTGQIDVGTAARAMEGVA
jgi:type I restriction enzyme S subunit